MNSFCLRTMVYRPLNIRSQNMICGLSTHLAQQTAAANGASTVIGNRERRTTMVTKVLKDSMGQNFNADFNIFDDALTNGHLLLNGRFFKTYFPDSHILVKEILLGLAGGRGYNLLTNPDSDSDLRGIIIADPRSFLSFGNPAYVFENIEKEKNDNGEKKKTLTDATLWDIGEFLKNLRDGTPNMEELLWIDPLAKDKWGEELTGNRDKLISTKIHGRLGGFSKEQMKDVMKALASGKDSPYKAAHHALRTLSSALYADKTGIFKVSESGEWAEYLKAVKRGEVSIDDVKKTLDDIETEWKSVRENSVLPKNIDEDFARNLLIQSRMAFLEEILDGRKVKDIYGVSADDGTTIELIDGRKSRIFAMNPTTLLEQPLTEIKKEANNESMELRYLMDKVRSGDPLIISSLIKNRSLLKNNGIGKFVSNNLRDTLNNSIYMSVPAFLDNQERIMNNENIPEEQRKLAEIRAREVSRYFGEYLFNEKIQVPSELSGRMKSTNLDETGFKKSKTFFKKKTQEELLNIRLKQLGF